LIYGEVLISIGTCETCEVNLLADEALEVIDLIDCKLDALEQVE
jgi:hypothetical protein